MTTCPQCGAPARRVVQRIPRGTDSPRRSLRRGGCILRPWVCQLGHHYLTAELPVDAQLAELLLLADETMTLSDSPTKSWRLTLSARDSLAAPTTGATAYSGGDATGSTTRNGLPA